MRLIKSTLLALLVLLSQGLFAKTGLLFNVVSSGTPASVDITLCLNGKGPLSCQNYAVTALSLSITTTIPHHTYPYAGIRVNTPRFTVGNLGIDCTPIPNGFCLFSVSDTTPKNIIIVPGTLTIRPSTLPAGTLLTPYNQTITASDGTAPYTYSVSSGTLPPGLSLNSATGTISGSPTTDGTFAFTITANDSNAHTGSQNYSVSISGTLTLSPSSLPNAILFASYSQTITASGGVAPYTYAKSAGTLPPGLVLDPVNGNISGVPTTNGTYTFTIRATDANNNQGSQSYSIFVNGALRMTPSTLPSGTLNDFYSQTVVAQGGTAPYTYSISSGSLPTGLTLSAQGLISGTPVVNDAFNFDITATDLNGDSGTQSYSIDIAGSLTLTPTTLNTALVGAAYTQTLTTTGGTAPYHYRVENGQLPPGLSLGIFTGVISGTPTTAGTYSFAVKTTDSLGATGDNTYSNFVVSGVLTLTPTTLPSGEVGTAYSESVTASGGTAPYTYSITDGALPLGLSLSATTGAITGTPTVTDSTPFTITAQDSSIDSGSLPYTIDITLATTGLNGITLSNNGTIAWMISNAPANQIFSCAVNGLGLSSCTNAGATNLAGAENIVINSLGTIAFITNNQNNSVTQCGVSGYQLISCSAASTSDLNEPSGITINPTGDVAYITNPYSTSSSYITSCSVNADGIVANSCNQASDLNLNTPTSILLINGSNALITEKGNNNLESCDINPDNLLVDCVSAASGFNGPLSMALNPSSTFLFVVNESNNTITQCTVSGTTISLCGAASGITSGLLQVPFGIVINPAGNVVFMTNGVVTNSADSVIACTLSGTTFSNCASAF